MLDCSKAFDFFTHDIRTNHYKGQSFNFKQLPLEPWWHPWHPSRRLEFDTFEHVDLNSQQFSAWQVVLEVHDDSHWQVSSWCWSMVFDSAEIGYLAFAAVVAGVAVAAVDCCNSEFSFRFLQNLAGNLWTCLMLDCLLVGKNGDFVLKVHQAGVEFWCWNHYD